MSVALKFSSRVCRALPPNVRRSPRSPFRGERRLTSVERQILARWEAVDAPEGDPAALPPFPDFPDGWRIGRPDHVVELDVQFPVPTTGRDLFRNFVLPVGLARPRHVAAVEIRPGNPRVAHHAILMVERSGASRRLDAADELPGYPGMQMGDARPPDGHFLGWTPGKAPYEPDPDMAFTLQPGDDLVLQLHMVTTGKVEQVRPRIGFRFTDRTPTRRPHALVLYREDIDIPAGDDAWELSDAVELPVPVELTALYPHAHYLARRMLVTAERPGADPLELLRIDAWNFDWQDEYRYVEPVSLPAGTVVRFDYVYDNSADNPENPHTPPRRVTFGERSVDEMGTLTLQVVPQNEDDRHALEVLRYRRALAKNPEDWVALDGLGVLLAERGRVAEAERAFRTALSMRPDAAGPRSNLGHLLANTGRAEEALTEWRRALTDDPDHYLARFNLANTLLRAGAGAAAERELRELVRRHPDAPGALAALGACLAMQGRFADALPFQERAVELRPGAAELHNDLATTLLFGLERVDAAIAEYERAIAARPDYFHARLNLGRAWLRRGDPVAAREHLGVARRLRPEDPAVTELWRAATAGR